jgi:hypothetical protein
LFHLQARQPTHESMVARLPAKLRMMKGRIITGGPVGLDPAEFVEPRKSPNRPHAKRKQDHLSSVYMGVAHRFSRKIRLPSNSLRSNVTNVISVSDCVVPRMKEIARFADG